VYKTGKVGGKAHFASLVALGVALKCSGNIDATVRRGRHCERNTGALGEVHAVYAGMARLVT
jgi:hypothetical protein